MGKNTTTERVFSEEQFQIVKAIKNGFVCVQKEMWKHRGKLTCGMVYQKKKTNQDLSYKSKRDL